MHRLHTHVDPESREKALAGVPDELEVDDPFIETKKKNREPMSQIQPNNLPAPLSRTVKLVRSSTNNDLKAFQFSFSSSRKPLPSEASGISGGVSRVGVQGPGGGTLDRPPSPSPTDPSRNDKVGEEPLSARMWAERTRLAFLTCPRCMKTCVDPVSCPLESIMTCRSCAQFDTISELPSSVLDLLSYLTSFASSAGMPVVGNAKSFQMLSADPSTSPVLEPLSTGPALAADTEFVLTQKGEERASAQGSQETNMSSRSITELGEAPLAASEENLESLEAAEAKERSQIHKGEELEVRSLLSRAGSLLKAGGDNFYDQSKYNESVAFYSHSLALRIAHQLPGIQQVYGNRSAAYYMLQEFDNCCQDCKLAAENGSTSQKLKFFFRGARSALMLGDFNRALEFIKSTPEEAWKEEEKLMCTRCEQGKQIFELSEQHFGMEEGDQYYRTLLAMFSSNSVFRLRFAESLKARGLYKKATEVLKPIPPFFRPPQFRLLLAECYYQSGFEFFSSALDILRPLQSHQDCREAFEKISALDKDKQDGNTAFSKRLFVAAVRCYTSAIEKGQDNKRILRILFCNRAAAYKELLKFKESISDCSKAIENDPKFWKAYARRARCHMELSDPYAAASDFKAAIENDTQHEDPNLYKELREAENRIAEEGKREKDYYYQLGLNKNATEKDIKMKYRELSLIWHPDKCVGKPDSERSRAELKFKLISEAYSILSDPQKRRNYDFTQAYSSAGSSFGSSFTKNRSSTTAYHYW